MSTTACANGSVSDIDWDVNDVPEGGVSDVSLTPEDVAHVNGGLVIDNHTGGASGLDDGDVAMGEANRGPTGASDAEEGTADDAEDAAMEDAEVSSDEDDVLPPRRRAGARSMPRNSASSSDDSAPIPGNCGPCPADVVFDKCARRLDREDGDVLYVDDSSEGGSDEDSRQRTELGAHLGQLAQVGGGGILAPVGARFVPYEGYVVELGAAAIASTFRGGYLGRGVQTTFTVKVRGDTGTRFKDVPMSGVVVEEALDENGMVVFKVVYTDGDVSDLSLGDLGRCMDSERFNVMDGGRKEQLIAVVGPHGVSADLGISYGFRASMDGVGRKNTYVHWSGGSADMTENNFFTMSVAKVVGEILHVGICLGAEVDIPQRLETGYRVVWDDKSVQTSVGQEDLVKMCYEFVQRADENISPDKRAFPIRVAIRGELAPGMIAPWVRVEEESESESSGESESEAEWGG